jgi:D-glycero-alpha-D-manno-heptose 1-phosphate guanylyltransferase
MMESIILAGGQGTRLRALVPDLPKPMADIAGRPFLWWLMNRLKEQGVGRVVLSVGYKAEIIQDYFGPTFNGLEISYVIEKTPLGTGGAIKFALEQAKGPHVIVFNGDSYVDVNLQDLMTRFEAADTPLAVVVTYLKNSAPYGSIAIEEKTNRITAFREKQSLGAGYVNAGIYFLRRDIFANFSTAAQFSFEHDFLPKQLGVIKPLALHGVQAFIDIGVPEDYALAQTLIPTLAAG